MKKQLSIALVLFLLTGCASLLSESQYPVTIDSHPTGAHFAVVNDDGLKMHQGRTPSIVTLESSDGYFSPAEYTVTFKKKNFLPSATTVKGKLDGWYIGNFFFGGFLGILVIDPLTGAMWKLPKATSVNLQSR